MLDEKRLQLAITGKGDPSKGIENGGDDEMRFSLSRLVE